MLNKKIYTTKETAEILGYASDAVIRLMIKQGRIKADRFGSMWMISKSEIRRLLKWLEKKNKKRKKLLEKNS